MGEIKNNGNANADSNVHGTFGPCGQHFTWDHMQRWGNCNCNH